MISFQNYQSNIANGTEGMKISPNLTGRKSLHAWKKCAVNMSSVCARAQIHLGLGNRRKCSLSCKGGHAMTRMKAKRQTSSVRKLPIPAEFQFALLLAEPKPVRGVKLKHVSAFTMLLSVLCLCAFIIGRVDAVPAGKVQQGQKVRR